MTHKSAKGKQSRDEAFALLFPDGDVDLSADTYQLEVARLRRGSAAAAKKVEATLDPYLSAQVFTRRQVDWESTSLGLHARLQLLHVNPHVEHDVQDIRRSLGLDPDVLRGREDDSLWLSLVSGERSAAEPAKAGSLDVRRQRATVWMAAHERFVAGRDADDVIGSELSPEAIRMADTSAQVDLAHTANPGWLRQGVTAGAPLDDAVARLCRRHLLPHTLDGKTCLAFYILTDDKVHLKNISFPLTLFALDSLEGGAESVGIIGSFSATIAGIDEYLSKQDWDALWTGYIGPLQERLLKRRGSEPQGRYRVDLERLRKGMPIYREVVLTGCTPGAALEALEKRGHSFARPGYGFAKSMDASTALRLVKDLQRLLEPKE